MKTQRKGWQTEVGKTPSTWAFQVFQSGFHVGFELVPRPEV